MANFEVKDFELLKASLLNYIYYSDNELTDFNVGAVMRCMLEAVAQEEEEIYFRLWQGIQKAIQESILSAFNFVPVQGTYASGLITFGRDNPATTDTVVPAGTIVAAASGNTYKTLADATIALGTYSIDVTVIATTYGSSYNIFSPNTPVNITNPMYGVSWAKTASAISGGTDTESQSSLFYRFTQYIDSLSRGTIAAIQYGASLAALTDVAGNVTERVIRVKAYDFPSNLGYVDCFIDNGTGTASGGLVTKAQQIIDGYTNSDGILIEGYKAAGVKVVVSSVSPVAIDMTLTLTADDFYGVKPYVESAVSYYFSKLDIGQTVNYEKLIADTFYSNAGVRDITISSPQADIAVGTHEIAILGTLAIVAG